jgi:HAD superfamily hydrolase (TIGR01509 family)
MGAPLALIFDMDGTLVDSMPAHARSWAVFAGRHGLAMDTGEILRRTTGRNGAECMWELFGRDLPEDRAWALSAEKEAVYREQFGHEVHPVPGAREFIQRSRDAGLKLAVASGGDRHNCAFAVGRLAPAPAPHALVSGDEGLPGKPEPALFLEAARRLDVAPADCIVFEDAPFGIEAARRAGMRAVAITTTHSPADLAGSHVLAHARDFRELLTPDFLESLNA